MASNRPGFLKYAASFFAEIPIESVSGPLNPRLDIVLSAGRYKLNTETATYSFEDKYGSFGTALEQVKDALPKFKSALVLGLGLGSIPFILLKKYRFTGEIICVEIDPLIIQLAAKYFPIWPIPENLEFIQQDAADFIGSNHRKFDLVAIDLFIDRDIPKKFHDLRFLEALKKSVAPGGILLFSRLTDNFTADRPLNLALKNIFPDAGEIDTGGNLILHWNCPNNS